MTTYALILGGYHELGNQEITLVHGASLYNYVLSSSINVEYCNVKSKYEVSNYIRSYSYTDASVVYLIYIGHGEGVNDVDYPYISPFETLDISSVKLKNVSGNNITFRIIYNCCNIKDIRLSNNPHCTSLDSDVLTRISNFTTLDFRYICLRKGLSDHLSGNSTTFNRALIDTVINYSYDEINTFLTLLNHNVGVSYKISNNIRNNRIKKYIDSSEQFNASVSIEYVNSHKISDIELPDNYFIDSTNCIDKPYIDYHAQYSDIRDVFGTNLNEISLT